MKTIQPRTSEQYATLAAVTRDDLAPHLRPSDWGSGTKNSLRAALEVFDLLAAGAAIVMPTTHEERVAEALQADEQRKALAEQCTRSAMRGDVWRTVDGKVALVVDSSGYSTKWDRRMVSFWRCGRYNACDVDDFGLLLTSLNVASIERPTKGGE